MLPSLDHPARFQQDSPQKAPERPLPVGARVDMPFMAPVRQVTARRLAARSRRAYASPCPRVEAGDPPRRIRRALPAWSCRATYVALIKSVADTPECRQVCRRHNIAVTTWVAAMTAAAIKADTRTGMCRASYEAIARDIARGTKQVQRAFTVARHFGLALEVYRARELTPLERKALRAAAGGQRPTQTGTTQIWQLAYIPATTAARFSTVTPGRFTMYLPKVHPLPLGRVSFFSHLTFTHLCSLTGAAETATRPRHRQRRGRADRRAWSVAAQLVRIVPWLAGERPARLAPCLSRFATASPAWEAVDVLAAMRDHATRSGRDLAGLDTAVLRHQPYVVLAGLLRQLDPVQDYPGTAFEQPDLTTTVCQICGTRSGRTRDLPLAMLVCDECWNHASQAAPAPCPVTGCEDGWVTTTDTTGHAHPTQTKCPTCSNTERTAAARRRATRWATTQFEGSNPDEQEPLF